MPSQRDDQLGLRSSQAPHVLWLSCTQRAVGLERLRRVPHRLTRGNDGSRKPCGSHGELRSGARRAGQRSSRPVHVLSYPTSVRGVSWGHRTNHSVTIPVRPTDAEHHAPGELHVGARPTGRGRPRPMRGLPQRALLRRLPHAPWDFGPEPRAWEPSSAGLVRSTGVLQYARPGRKTRPVVLRKLP
jgi:hypothetical protein